MFQINSQAFDREDMCAGRWLDHWLLIFRWILGACSCGGRGQRGHTREFTSKGCTPQKVNSLDSFFVHCIARCKGQIVTSNLTCWVRNALEVLLGLAACRSGANVCLRLIHVECLFGLCFLRLSRNFSKYTDMQEQTHSICLLLLNLGDTKHHWTRYVTYTQELSPK